MGTSSEFSGGHESPGPNRPVLNPPLPPDDPPSSPPTLTLMEEDIIRAFIAATNCGQTESAGKNVLDLPENVALGRNESEINGLESCQRAGDVVEQC